MNRVGAQLAKSLFAQTRITRPRHAALLSGLATTALLAAACGSYVPASTEALTTIASDTSQPEPMAVAAYEPEESFLNHPTLLPEGWELCRHLERADTGDRFCPPDEEEAWLQIATKPADRVRLDLGESIEGSASGVWLSRVDRIEAAFPFSTGDVVVVTSAVIPEQVLLAIAESIPLVGSRGSLYGEYELPLALEDVTDEQLTGLLGNLGEQVRVTRRDLEASVFTSVVILRLFAADELYVPTMAPWIPKPRLIDANRPVVVGESASQRRTFVIWDQRGYGWRLEGQMTVEDASELALEIIELVAGLP